MAAYPILSCHNNEKNDGKDQWECLKDTCAWYINGKCAIVLIAETADQAKI